MRQLAPLCCLALLGALLPAPAHGQGAAIVVSRPATVPDSTWIEDHCASIAELTISNESLAAAVERARGACEAYRQSAKDESARDAWVLAMLELQDDVGPRAMRDFVPDLGPQLPSGLGSYSLFLFPSQRWLDENSDGDIEQLLEEFYTFGRSIGDEFAAIWFLDQEGNVDVLRSQQYSDQFGLDYDDGPYVVTVEKRPDLLQPNDEIVVIRMGGIAPRRVGSILLLLAQDLRTTDNISAGPLLYEELKQFFLTLAVDRYPRRVRAFVASVL